MYPQLSNAADLKPATVLVYRTHSLQATLADAFIGVEEGYFTKLSEDQFTRFELDPGFHLFRTGARGSVSSQTHIKVNPGETLCIESRPNYEELEWLMVPFLNALIPSFVLEETPCPTEETLKQLTAI